MSKPAPPDLTGLALPAPYSVERQGGHYRFNPNASLRARGYDGPVGPMACPLREAGFGSKLEVLSDGPPLLTFDRPGEDRLEAAEKALADLLDTIDDPRVADQAYVIEVGTGGVAAMAKTAAGLFHAARTLARLMTADGAIGCVSIKDRPRISHRAALLDLSRGKVASLASMMELVDLLAALKFNQLTFNIEHVFHCPKHPEIGKGHDRVTREEMERLVEYAAGRHVEIIPFQQSLGHMRHTVSLKKYKGLAYDPELQWSLDPSNKKIHSLLADLYDAQIEATTSRIFHVGCDEPFDMIKRFDKKKFGGRPIGKVIRDHLIVLHQMLAERGRTMMCWADAVLAHPEILPDLPDDLILCHWLYGSGALEGPEHYRAGLETIAGRGLPFYACTCTWSLMKPHPDLEVMRANHEGMIGEAKRQGAIGAMATIWGDMGHMNPIGLEDYPLALAARHFWEDAPVPEADFGKAYSWTVCHDSAGLAAELAETADEVNRLVAGPAGLAGVGMIQLFNEPLSTALLDAPDGGLGPLAAKLGVLAKKVRDLLDKVLATKTSRKNSLSDYELAAAQIDYLADKFEVIGMVEDAWPGPSPDRLKELAGLMDEMAYRTEDLLALLERRWLASAKPSGLSVNRKRYGRLAKAWRARAKQFVDLAEGGKPPELSGVLASGPEGYQFNMLDEIGLAGLL